MAAEAPQTAARMAEAASELLAALSDEQRDVVVFPFADEEERRDWHYTPYYRGGLPLIELDTDQQRLTMRLVGSGLSIGGFVTVSTIIGLELALEGLEDWLRRPYAPGGTHPRFRDPGMYFVAVFGDPGGAVPWGWRFGGHHVAIQYTLAGSEVSGTPCFFGANPAHVAQVGTQVLRPLAAEEDLARGLLRSLDDGQRARALISEAAPIDIVQSNRPVVEDGVVNRPMADLLGPSGDGRRVTVEREASLRSKLGLTSEHDEALRYSAAPKGLPAAGLAGDQRGLLTTLIRQYTDRLPEELAAPERARILDGLDAVHFAWAGSVNEDEPHYYRLQGHRFLIEYDNVQNDANHIHSVWRDPEGDFGGDVLAQHRAHAH